MQNTLCFFLVVLSILQIKQFVNSEFIVDFLQIVVYNYTYKIYKGGNTMIVSNLAVLLSERGLTAKKVSQDTGISRPTLTSLTQNRGNGIQYDTLNTLCNYLNVTPNDIVSYVPYEFELEYEWIDSISLTENVSYIEGLLLVTMKYTDKTKQQKECNILLSINCTSSDPYRPDDEDDTDFYINVDCDINAVWDYEENPDDYEEIFEYDNCYKFYKIWSRLPQVFKRKIEDEIISEIINSIYAEYDIENISLSGNTIPLIEPTFELKESDY